MENRFSSSLAHTKEGGPLAAWPSKRDRRKGEFPELRLRTIGFPRGSEVLVADDL